MLGGTRELTIDADGTSSMSGDMGENKQIWRAKAIKLPRKKTIRNVIGDFESMMKIKKGSMFCEDNKMCGAE